MQCSGESGFSVHVSEFRSQLPDCSLHMLPQLKAKDSIVLSAAMKRLASAVPSIADRNERLTPGSAAQPDVASADSSAGRPAHDSSGSPGATWAYFNLWDGVDADDYTPPNVVVLTTRRLQRLEEMRLVDYFCRSGKKRLPPGLPYANKGEIYGLSAKAMIAMHKLAVDNKQIQCVAIITMVPPGCEADEDSDSCTMHVKRMTVAGKEELIELSVHAYRKVAYQNAAVALSSGSAARPASIFQN